MKYSLIAALIFFSQFFIASGAISENNPKYKEAIDTHRWCSTSSSGWTKIGHKMELTQLMEGLGIYQGEGWTFLIPVDQLSGELYQGRTLADSARYIGLVKKGTLPDRSGFGVDIELYDVIDRDAFLSAGESYGADGC